MVPILIMAKQQEAETTKSEAEVGETKQQELESSTSADNDEDDDRKKESTAKADKETKRLKALEAKAVAEATATADSSFIPSPSLLNASSAAVLLKQVDGPSLSDYEGKESIYVGRSVPVSAGGTLAVPIQVSTPGSVVEYAVENKQYDIGFAISAEREEGVTIVKVSFFRAFPKTLRESFGDSCERTAEIICGSCGRKIGRTGGTVGSRSCLFRYAVSR